MTEFLEVRAVSARLGTRVVLHDVSFGVAAGRVTVIIGPNGAGKSTLLRVLSGELMPLSGVVTLAGRALRAIDARELAALRAVMPQAAVLAFPFRVEEVVGLGASVPAFGVRHSRDAVADAMAMSDITYLAGRSYTSLSGGERQRVQFARALCQLLASRTPPENTVLLLDEPTSSLDLPHQMQLMARAHAQARQGRAVVAVLHDLNLAASWADHIVAIGNGRIVAAGTARDVLTTHWLSQLYQCRVPVSSCASQSLPTVLPQVMRTAYVLDARLPAVPGPLRGELAS